MLTTAPCKIQKLQFPSSLNKWKGSSNLNLNNYMNYFSTQNLSILILHHWLIFFPNPLKTVTSDL